MLSGFSLGTNFALKTNKWVYSYSSYKLQNKFVTHGSAYHMRHVCLPSECFLRELDEIDFYESMTFCFKKELMEKLQAE